MRGALAKVGHLAWSVKGPDLLTALRRSHRIRPGTGWYHDYPTLALALLAVAGRCGAAAGGRGSAGRSDAVGGGDAAAECLRAGLVPGVAGAVAGAAFHAASVRVLARRVPQYDPSRLPTAEAAQTVLIAAAEEVVWETEARENPLGMVLGVTGFGLVHAKRGGRPAVVHMMVFAALARAAQEWGGGAASVWFHSGYNLAHHCDRGRHR